MVQVEPWAERDKAMIDMLKFIGIEKGKSFSPDTLTQAILKDAAIEARGWLAQRFETGFPAYYPDRQWAVVAPTEIMETMGSCFERPDIYAVDGRGLVYSYAFACSKHPGGGQFYLFTARDSEGRFLDGGSLYRLGVPAQVPAGQYWSATVYDRATYTFIRHVVRANRSSQSPDLHFNQDGSTDIWFGPRPPAGRETSWIPTRPGGQFIVCVRFYGPEKPLFDKSWSLPDIERVYG
jgi:hypothetical protein